LSRETAGWWSLGPNIERRSTEYASLTQRGAWYLPVCREGDAEGDGEGDGEPRDDAGEQVRWIALPRVALDGAALGALRRGEASLGTCGARIDGTSPFGALLEGAAAPASASMTALLAQGGPLVIEIDDDRWAEGDRVEVLLGRERPSYLDDCRESSAVQPPRRYVIHVTSGAVRAAGRGPRLRVERHARGGRVLLFVTLPEGVHAISLAYSDDDGRGVVRRIASSTIDARDDASLGEVVDFADASCRVTDGALVPVVDMRVHASEPINVTPSVPP
jgi:hypothetical protein